MRHRKQGRKLKRPTAHRMALLRNLATSLILHERIQTTLAKAKEVQRFAEPLITFAKRGDLHARRLAAGRLLKPEALKKLFSEIGARYQTRNGGYTRIYRLERRRGDGAPLALLELVVRQIPEEEKGEGKSPKSSEKKKGNVKPTLKNAK